MTSAARVRAVICAVLAALAATGCTTTTRRDPADPAALAGDLDGHAIVVFGETHDNAAQQALRAATLRLAFEHGARPALAFEQFDRERQADIDAVRRDGTGSSSAEVAARIVALGSRGWNWDFYRPYLRLALDYQVPIVAANLSRADAIRVARDGFDAVLTPAQQVRLGLDRLAPVLLTTQQREIEAGHCGLLPADDVAPLARAQIARDAMMALEIAPHEARGVILLTGNGHARRDVGVAHFLALLDRHQAPALTIGLLEDAGGGDPLARAFDVVVTTPAQPRPDPCEELRRNPPGPVREGGAK